MAGYWLKLYTEILDDSKYFKLSDCAKVGLFELLLVAKRRGNNGELPNIEEIAFQTRKAEEWWKPVLKELLTINFIIENGKDIVIRKFADRQAPIPGAERAKQSRTIRNAICHDTVTEACETHALSYETNGDRLKIESETEEKQKEEAEKPPASAAPAQKILPTTTQYLEAGRFALQAFSQITGMVTFPAKDREAALVAIESLRLKHDTVPKMVDYLRPFYDDWLKRKYSKTNLAWLTDWAVSGEIPKGKVVEKVIIKPDPMKTLNEYLSRKEQGNVANSG